MDPYILYFESVYLIYFWVGGGLIMLIIQFYGQIFSTANLNRKEEKMT